MGDFAFVVAGAAVGFLVGLTGVGGGALMTPFLLLAGIPAGIAVGTDLWFAALTKLGAVGMHQQRGVVDWQVVRRLWCGSLPGSAATQAWLKFQESGGDFSSLRSVIAWAVVLTAAGMLFQPQLHAFGQRMRLSHAQGFKGIQAPLTVVAGALLGVLVTLTSVGAGALGAVMLVYLYPLRLTPVRLVATDLAHAVPLALFAGVGYWWIGSVDFSLLLTLLTGSMPGVFAGVWLSGRLPQGVLRWILALVLCGIGGRLLW